MLHTKTTSPEMTSKWQSKCPRNGSSSKSSCAVGIPFLENLGSDVHNSTIDLRHEISVYKPNCYRHSRVVELIPQLEKALQLYKNISNT